MLHNLLQLHTLNHFKKCNAFQKSQMIKRLIFNKKKAFRKAKMPIQKLRNYIAIFFHLFLILNYITSNRECTYKL